MGLYKGAGAVVLPAPFFCLDGSCAITFENKSRITSGYDFFRRYGIRWPYLTVALFQTKLILARNLMES